MNPRGFTLIEALIYLGLLSIVLGGSIVSAFNIVEATNREQARLMLEQEGSFIISKINWAISGSQSVNTPGAGSLARTSRLIKSSASMVTACQLSQVSPLVYPQRPAMCSSPPHSAPMRLTTPTRR